MPYRIKIESKASLADEAHLLSGMERLGFALAEHRKPILIGIVLVLLAGAVVGAILWMDYRNEERALALDQQATRLYLDRPVDQPAKADEHIKQAITIYRQLLEQYPRTRTAPLALYHLGNALVQVDDLGGAADAYQRFIASYGSGNPSLLALVYQRLGYAYLLKGDMEKAEQAFTAVLNMADALNKDQVLFELGKMEEARSRPEGAMARYQDLIKTYPNSPFLGEATVRSKALEVKKTPNPPSQSEKPGQGK